MCHSMESQTLGEARQVRLFRIGPNQAIRIPRGFELPGGEAAIRKVGDRLILEPVHRKSLLQVLSAMVLGLCLPPRVTFRLGPDAD